MRIEDDERHPRIAFEVTRLRTRTRGVEGHALVVAEGAGHDPVKATGLVLAHLPGICAKTDPDVPQLWVLRATTQAHEKPWERLRRIAKQCNRDIKELYKEVKLTDKELAK